jgi:predicted site-specific integrase-resolvase
MSDSKKGKMIFPKFLLANEAAEFLRVKVRTLANWRARKTGPAWRKHGGKVVYTLEELERYSGDEDKTHVG